MQVLGLLYNLRGAVASRNGHVRRRFPTADVGLVEGSEFEGRGFGPWFRARVPSRLLDVEFDCVGVVEGVAGGLPDRVIISRPIPGSCILLRLLPALLFYPSTLRVRVVNPNNIGAGIREYIVIRFLQEVQEQALRKRTHRFVFVGKREVVKENPIAFSSSLWHVVPNNHKLLYIG